MDPITPTHDDRLLALERRCARLRLWCVGVTGVALASCLTSALHPTPDTVEARSFVVRGPDGSVRARLGIDEESSRLSLYSNDNKSLAELIAEDQRPGSVSSVMLYMEGDTKAGNSVLAVSGGEISGIRVSDQSRSVDSFVRGDSAYVHILNKKPEPATADEGHFPDEALETDPSLRFDITGDKATITGKSATGEVLFKLP